MASYTDLDGHPVRVEYDPGAPCWMCGEAVVSASMSGTVVCPWCDCGQNRDGSNWTHSEAERAFARFRENVERVERERDAELTRQAETEITPLPRARPSLLAELWSGRPAQ